MTHQPIVQQSRVVVTGMGVASGFGFGLDVLMGKLVQARSAVGEVTLFDTSDCLSHHAAQVPDMAQGELSRASQMSMRAIDEALADAGLKSLHDDDGVRTSLSLSTTGGSMYFFENFIRQKIQQGTHQAVDVSQYHPQRQVHDIIRYLDHHGPHFLVANACASGGNAIGHGRDLILAGLADRVLVGAFEELSELIYVGFDRLQSISTTCCKPFDTERDGLMLGEGAAFLVLESLPLALARGAHIVGEVCGYGHTTDTHHVTQPHPQGVALTSAITAATHQAETLGYRPSEIGYVNAHGTATPANDLIEGNVIATYLDVIKADGAMVSSTKAALGHTLGAAGSIEACICLASLQRGKRPPQINTEKPLDVIARRLVPLDAPATDSPMVLNVNLGFGGSNCALIFRRYED